ncbi:MAG: hypothetical protein ABEJ79_12420 [Halolamina sp.]
MSRSRSRSRPVATLAEVAAVGVAAARAGAGDVPLSPLHADGHVGADWPDRRDVRGERVAGEMASLSAYARPDFDPDTVDPAVRALYERTADFGLTLTATWHRPFRLGARLASRVTSRVEQLNLAGPGGSPKRVSSDLFELAEPAATADPREAPRLWVRTDDDTGEAVFVAVYASHTVGDERLVNVAVPLPGASLATVLRMTDRGDGLELTTDCPDGGLYLHTDAGAFELPACQRFHVSPSDGPAAPDPPTGVDPAAADVLAAQRIRLLGLPLVTIRYAATEE